MRRLRWWWRVAPDLHEGLARAAASVDSGAAAGCLKALVKLSVAEAATVIAT